ncbi:MAG: hypothetical protein WC860_03850 [Candidatus Margulisiibacteriota bacterium]|jgi:hypothetical protein
MILPVNKLKKISWYRQGAAGKPLYVSYPLQACDHFYLKDRPIDLHYEYIVMDLYKNNLKDWLWIDNLKDVADYYLQKEYKQKDYIKHLYKWWKIKHFYSLSKELKLFNSKKLAKYSNNQLIQQFVDISEKYLLAWRNCIFQDAYDYWGDKILLELILKSGNKIDNQSLQKLFTPSTQTIYSKQQLDFNKIVNLVKNNKKIKLIVQKENLQQLKLHWPKIYLLILKHSTKYSWMHNDYATVTYLNDKYFFLELKKKINEKNKFKYKKIKLPTINNDIAIVVNFLNIISAWRDDRKALGQIALFTINNLIKEISLRTKININFFEHMFWFEIPKVFKMTKVQKKEINLRIKKGILYYVDNMNRHQLFYGNERKKLLNLLNKATIKHKLELTGMPVSGGVITGKVKIIMDKNDFSKLKKMKF